MAAGIAKRVYPCICFVINSSHREALHRRFILGGHIRQRQLPIHRQTLLGRMTTEQLELGADNPLLRQIRDELMTKQMRIDPLGNPSGRWHTP